MLRYDAYAYNKLYLSESTKLEVWPTRHLLRAVILIQIKGEGVVQLTLMRLVAYFANAK